MDATWEGLSVKCFIWFGSYLTRHGQVIQFRADGSGLPEHLSERNERT